MDKVYYMDKVYSCGECASFKPDDNKPDYPAGVRDTRMTEIGCDFPKSQPIAVNFEKGVEDAYPDRQPGTKAIYLYRVWRPGDRGVFIADRGL